jgi:predicted RNA binding protein YcfA (HicA-like mRNA interferase family)
VKIIFGKQMCRVLELRGWTLARINGSHHIYRDHATGRRTVVPVHANRDLRRLARTLTPAKPAWRPPGQLQLLVRRLIGSRRSAQLLGQSGLEPQYYSV